MFKVDYSVFFGQEDQFLEDFFLVEENIFFIVEGKDGNEKKFFQEVINNLKTNLKEKNPKNLNELNQIIDQSLKKIGDKILSFSFGYLTNDGVFYLKTLGEGEITLYRGGKLFPLIKNNQTASGYIKAGDFFIFSHQRFLKLIDSHQLERQIKGSTPKELLEKITPLAKEKDDRGAIALFLSFNHQVEEEEKTDVYFNKTEEKGTRLDKESWFEKLKTKSETALFGLKQKITKEEVKTSKKLTFFLIFLLFLLFLWSVVFGYQRREREKTLKQINLAKEKINEKLNEALDLSSINLDRSLELLSEAKNEVEKLKTEVKKSDANLINELEDLIKKKEKEIVKKEEKGGEEYYDLKLINNQAKGEKMYLEGEVVAILNSSNSEIYLLSLTKKSHQVIKGDEIKKASLVALYNNTVFYFNQEKGIYKTDDSGKKDLAIKPDPDWGQVVDFWIYNGNLYLLDIKNDEIYKYLVTEGGYSNKSSYFQRGESIDLANIKSIAIDSSIYLAGDDLVVKYNRGAREEFKTDFPNKEKINIDKVYTDKNTNKIYFLDKKNGVILITNKQGKYERQINSSLLKKANDFVVMETKGIFLLVNDKIYLFTLD